MIHLAIVSRLLLNANITYDFGTVAFLCLDVLRLP